MLYSGISLETEDGEGGLSYTCVNMADATLFFIKHICTCCTIVKRCVHVEKNRVASPHTGGGHDFSKVRHVLNLSKVRACRCKLGLSHI
jgi:hypothetical protein